LANEDAEKTYKDRRTGLMVFGVVQLLFALLFCGMLALIAAVLPKMPRQPGGAGAYALFTAMGMYAFAALLFGVLGIGSILRKGWARIGTLVLSWIWLVLGVISSAATAVALPMVLNQPGHELPESMRHVMVVSVAGFMAVFFLLVPLAFVLFYSRKDVAATCAGSAVAGSRPVLPTVLAIFFGITAISAAVPSPYALPHTATCVYHAVMAVLFGFMCWGFVRFDRRGWWTATIVLIFTSVLGMASALFTLRDPTATFLRSGLSAEQLRIMQSLPNFVVFAVCGGVGFTLLLLWATLYSRRYFVSAQQRAVPAE